MKRIAKQLSRVALAMLVLAVAQPAYGTKYFDGQRGEIQARLATQNAFQHDGTQDYDWVQFRNEMRFDLKYNLIPYGQVMGPFQTLKFNILYRARYDAVYDIRDSYEQHGYDRDDFRFPEGKYPRELFVDMGFAGPLKDLSVRVGRQQVVWGEADLFRSLDVVNPLRVDQNGFVGEDFSDYREPLWVAKFLYNIGNMGFLEGAGLEFFYSPDSRPQADRFNLIVPGTYRIHEDQRNILDGFKTLTMQPSDQEQHPWEVVRVGGVQGGLPNLMYSRMDAPGTVQNADGTLSDFYYQIRSDTPRSELSFDRSMVGVRLLGTTFGQAYVTFNYLFKRSDRGQSQVAFHEIFDKSQPGTGALVPAIQEEAFAMAATPDNNGNGIPDGQEQQIRDCIDGVSPELILAPQFLGRTDVPFRGSVRTPLDVQGANGLNAPPFNADATAPGGRLVGGLDTGATSTACLSVPRKHSWTHIAGMTLTYNDYDWTGLVWRLEQSYSTKEPSQGIPPSHPSRVGGCVDGNDATPCDGVPRARDFSTMNSRTYSVWRSMVGFDYLRSINPALGRRTGNPILRSLLSDQWFFTFQFLNEYLSHADQYAAAAAFSDRNQHHNPLFTFAATGFFMNNRFRPYFATGYELNQESPLFIAQFDYHLTRQLSMRLGEIIYAGSSHVGSHNFLNYYSSRDTTYLRFIYYIL